MRNYSWLALSVVISALAGMPALADGDAKKGKKVFKKCKACHMVGEKAKKRVGPPLNDLFGRKAAGFEGFKYSKVLVSMGEAGLVWNEETVAGYLKNPKKWLKAKAPELDLKCADVGNCRGKMAFGGLRKDKQIKNVIAYMKQFDQTPE